MYYLIGKKIGYSYSPYIHKKLGSYNYEIKEMNNISSFLNTKEFKGINITMPFKEEVIKYLDYQDPVVRKLVFAIQSLIIMVSYMVIIQIMLVLNIY